MKSGKRRKIAFTISRGQRLRKTNSIMSVGTMMAVTCWPLVMSFFGSAEKKECCTAKRKKKTKASIIRTAELARPGLTSPLLLSA